MKYASPLIGSALLLGVMLAASAWAWPQLGTHPIAVHFGFDGRPNGWAPPLTGVLILPGVAGLLTLLFAGLPPIMPDTARLERSWDAYQTIWLATLALLCGLHLSLLAHALGQPVNVGQVAAGGVGALFVVIGNLLGKVRYNYVMGIRTPWTLSSERVWDRTHRFVGRLMLAAGLVMAAAAVLTPPGAQPYLVAVVLVGGLLPAVAGMAYSYRESRRVEGV